MAWVRGHCLWIRRGRDGDASRPIFVVRRKLGNAVKRNRLKRRLRSICRERPFFPSNLVVLCQFPAVEAPFADLRGELDALVPKLPTSSP